MERILWSTHVSLELTLASSSPCTHSEQPDRQDWNLAFQTSTWGLLYANSLIKNVAAAMVIGVARQQNQWKRLSTGLEGMFMRWVKI